jgi:GNAT superfamily N-acetyltransferase
MWRRLKRSDFAERTGQKNKRAMKRIIDSDHAPGLLAYTDGNPVGWCSVAPRETYPALERSRALKRIDDEPVWSVVCFFVAKPFRSKGLMSSLLEAAVRYDKEHGAKIIEGYPVEPKMRRMSGSEGFTGLIPVFTRAGFVQALRRSPNRSIMRYFVSKE